MLQLTILVMVVVMVISSPRHTCELSSFPARRIQEGLAPFRTGIDATMLDYAASSPNTCLVVIKNREVVSKCLFAGWQCFIKSIAWHLPDMIFVVNLYDEPRVFKNHCTKEEDWRECACDKDYERPDHGLFIKPGNWKPIYESVPVFSPGSISSCFSDIIIPSHLHMSTPLIESPIPWKDKQFKAVWRGSTTGGDFGKPDSIYSTFHRHRFVEYCSSIEACDVKFSSYKQCNYAVCIGMRRRYGPPGFLSVDEQMASKIIMDIDGNTYSARFPVLLSTTSVIFKLAAFDDFGSLMAEPWMHYIPVRMDFKDLEKKLKWAQENDA